MLKDSYKAATPASNDLFKRGLGKLLGTENREIFHSIVAKYFFISDRSCPDINTTVRVLSGGVIEPKINDCNKCGRLVKYHKSTSNYISSSHMIVSP